MALYKRGTRFKYTLNDNFFSPPFTEESAYLLGFIAGDGFLGKRASVIGMHLAFREAFFLKKVARIMGVQQSAVKSSKVKQYAKLLLNSKKMYADLNGLGIFNKKSESINIKSIVRKLPSMLLRHFFRGLVDADGSIGIEKKKGVFRCTGVTLCGNYTTCFVFLKFMQEHGLGLCVTIRKDNRTKFLYSVRIGGCIQSKKVLLLLYTGSHLHLPRKKRRANLVCR